MVRRRCRFIVVSDAGCDPGVTFADLGNALRKIRIDLNVNITIDTVNIALRAEWQRDKSSFFALGTVHYPEGTENCCTSSRRATTTYRPT